VQTGSQRLGRSRANARTPLQSTRVCDNQGMARSLRSHEYVREPLGGNPDLFLLGEGSAAWAEKRGREGPCCAVDGKLIEEREEIPIQLKAGLEVGAQTGVERRE
jgi:hypothetical protein